MSEQFIKMHGLGNDFVMIFRDVIDSECSQELVRRLADRHTGIGCDQLLLVLPSHAGDYRVRIYNADGHEVGMCGNALRCVGAWVMQKTQKQEARITLVDGRAYSVFTEDPSRPLNDMRVTVDMGAPDLDIMRIPFLGVKHFPVDFSFPLPPAFLLSFGNPHCVFCFDSVACFPDLSLWGPILEKHELFPLGTNVEFCAYDSEKNCLHMRVWERGVGLTMACGSGACAVFFAAYTQGLIPEKMDVVQLGGTLTLELKNGCVLMTGSVSYVFKGEYD